MDYSFRIVNAFRIFTEKEILNYYWILWGFVIKYVFEIWYSYRVVKVFRILIGKMMVNDYWIVCTFVIISVFGM